MIAVWAIQSHAWALLCQILRNRSARPARPSDRCPRGSGSPRRRIGEAAHHEGATWRSVRFVMARRGPRRCGRSVVRACRSEDRSVALSPSCPVRVHRQRVGRAVSFGSWTVVRTATGRSCRTVVGRSDARRRVACPRNGVARGPLQLRTQLPRFVRPVYHARGARAQRTGCRAPQ